MSGRKPIHDFNTLKIGQKTQLKGRAKVYPHQYVNQYNKSGRRLIIIRDGDKIYVERIK